MYWNERSIMLRKLFVQGIVQSLSSYVYNFIRHTKRFRCEDIEIEIFDMHRYYFLTFLFIVIFDCMVSHISIIFQLENFGFGSFYVPRNDQVVKILTLLYCHRYIF